MNSSNFEKKNNKGLTNIVIKLFMTVYSVFTTI